MLRKILSVAIRVWCIHADTQVTQKLHKTLANLIDIDAFVAFPTLSEVQQTAHRSPHIIFAEIDHEDQRDDLLTLQIDFHAPVVAILPDNYDDLEVYLLQFGIVDTVQKSEINLRTLWRILRQSLQSNLIHRLQDVELKLRESQYFIERVLDTIPYAVNVFNINNTEWLFGNFRILEKLGYTAEEINAIGSRLNSSLVHPDEHGIFKRHLDEVLADPDKDTFSYEVRVKSKTGAWHWIYSQYIVFKRNSEGQPIQILGIAQDVTERRLLEDAVRTSESRYRSVINSQQAMVFRYHVETHQITFANGSFRHAFMDDDNVPYPATKLSQSFQDYLKQVTEQSPDARTAITSEYQVKDAMWFECTWQPIVDEDNQLLEVQGVLYDISDRKRAEQLLHRSLEREREMNTLQTRFIRTVSHEFRTPLAGIQLAVGSLDRHLERMTEAQRKDKIDKIYQYINRIVSLLDDVLLVSQVEEQSVELRLEPQEISSLVSEVIQQFRVSAEHDNRYIFKKPKQLTAQIDKPLFVRLVDNLLSNATKFSEPDTEIQVSLVRQDDYLTLTVEDKGIGIPQAEQDAVLTAFYRAQNIDEQAGTGLGLFIVQYAVQAHNGYLEIDSIEQQGTRVHVRLPLTQST